MVIALHRKYHNCSLKVKHFYIKPVSSSDRHPVKPNNHLSEEEFNCTLHADSFSCDFNSSVLNNDYSNKENLHERTFHCSYNNSVNLKFKSFDLLPGIMLLNDNLDLLSNNSCNNCNRHNE